MDLIQGIAQEAWMFLLMASPYMLLGLVVAGLLRSFLSPQQIVKYLGQNSVGSVLRAALFGVPLPLCSCGVIPTAVALRKQGASRGAVLAFLIATPESGVDSILMTVAMIDPIMAIARPVAALLSGIVAGIADIVLNRSETPSETPEAHCANCSAPSVTPSLVRRLREGFYFSFVVLLNDIGGWFLLGVFFAGIIGYAVPTTLIEQYMGGGWVSMLIVLAVSIPLYICAAGSTPIAAALILKGMSPGTALVFLIAGPATNAASLVVLSRFLGLRSTIIYLATIAIMSLLMGFALDAVYIYFDIRPGISAHVMDHGMQNWWEIPCTVILLMGIIASKLRKQVETPL